MKFVSSEEIKGIESMVSDREVSTSRFKMVVNGVMSSKDWKEHVAKCPIGGKLMFIDFGGRKVPIDELKNFEENILKKQIEIKSEETSEQQEHRSVQEEEAKKQQVQKGLMGNELYFGVAGGKRTLAGCECGMEQNVNVMHNPNTDYLFNALTNGSQDNKDNLYSTRKSESIDIFTSKLGYFESKSNFGKKSERNIYIRSGAEELY